MRKIKQVQLQVAQAMKESEAMVNKIAEMEQLAILAEVEEKAMLASVRQQIADLCKTHNLFCGAILGPRDLASIVELMIEQRDRVSINFELYFLKDDN
jgi:DNA-binding helix-hairpin-helix protein with protein kinase domain